MKLRRNIICIVLSLILIGMFVLTACNTDKDKEEAPDGFVTVDLGLEDYEVDMKVTHGSELNDTSNGSLILLHKFEELDVSMYYYEEYKEALGQEVHMQYIVLEKDGVYSTYYIPVDETSLDSELNQYTCYDYDADGELELAVTFVMIQYEDFADQKLFIFDYNDKEKSYDMYYFGLANMSKAIEEAIVKHFKEKYLLDYEWCGSSSGGNSMEVYGEHAFKTKNGTYLLYGRHSDTTFSDDGSIKMAVGVFEPVDYEAYKAYTVRSEIEGKNFYDIGYVICDIKYMGDGKFVVNTSEYTENPGRRRSKDA